MLVEENRTASIRSLNAPRERRQSEDAKIKDKVSDCYNKRGLHVLKTRRMQVVFMIFRPFSRAPVEAKDYVPAEFVLPQAME